MASVASIPVYMLPGAPALQPPRSALETGDPSLSTEVLPAPPTVSSVLQASSKRDPRKPTPMMSYLPQHDPGTTYSGVLTGPIVGSLESIPEVDGPRRKRVKLEKRAVAQLAQRGTARGINANPQVLGGPDVLEHMVSGQPLGMDSQINGWDPEVLSRSSSVVYPDEMPSGSKAARAKEKGKGKTKEKDNDKLVGRIKEEPSPTTLPLFSNANGGLSASRNEDHCSSCRSLGSLVYCDGCTRAYHLWCLDPPMEATDIPEGESRWLCPSCELQQNPPPRPQLSFLSSLIYHVQSNPPIEFQLPEDIRTFFKFVGTNPRGQYTDTSLIKAPRLNRSGQMEYRDPFRTKDKNGSPVLCFRCGSSALPYQAAQDAPIKRPRRSSARGTDAEQWRSIVSCDHCQLHWHLDCLSPPLLAMPPLDKKWMCPNHVDHTTRIKHRTPRQNPSVVDVSEPGQANNGNVEVLDVEMSSTHDKVAVDEVFINGKRYRIPERIIKLDFWDKIHTLHHPTQSTDGLLSPLTSLSSLDGEEGDAVRRPPPGMGTEDVRLALLLLDMARTSSSVGGLAPLKLEDTLDRMSLHSPDRPRATLPTATSGEQTHSAAKSGGSERKQPSRASKRNVRYSTALLESHASDDEEQRASNGRSKMPRSAPHPKPGKARQSRGQHKSSRATRAVKIEPSVTIIPSATPAPPTIRLPTSPVGQMDRPEAVIPPVSTQSATPTLKIRLPRFNLNPGLSTKVAPTSPVQTRTSGRPRRSLRRQTSTAGSSSTSVSKVDGPGSTESPKE
ncbi:hypothetical protein BC834DRAFT_855990 [Gloeopeniophorella convolvens]|nr:hypothetical protein BC834DRAFT_855990 [Gloeopeniophorella convolvens]